jgi:hypothetical protein
MPKEKDLFRRAIMLAVGSSALAFGCAPQTSETQEIIDNLVQAGSLLMTSW